MENITSKRQMTNWEKNLQLIIDKVLILLIHKALLKIQKTNNLIEKRTEDVNRQFTEKEIQCYLTKKDVQLCSEHKKSQTKLQ